MVRCGIDLDRFAYREPRPLPEVPVVATVCRLSPEKGLSLLLEAVAELGRRGRDVSLVVVGDGPERAAIEATVDRLAIGDRVRLLGELEPAAVADVLADADAFCLPSFAEGLPVSIMEAMATGLPVVATAVAGIPELVVDGDTGVLVPAGRVDLLADGLERILDDDDARRAIAKRARERVTMLHDGRTTAAAMRSLLASAVRDGHRT